jgi:hypothetical protein
MPIVPTVIVRYVMVLDKFTPVNAFVIFEPRYRDKVVLLNKRRVGAHNKITFTKAPSMGTQPYYANGSMVKKCKLDTNGTIPCYAVPLDKLEPLEINRRSVHELW